MKAVSQPPHQIFHDSEAEPVPPSTPQPKYFLKIIRLNSGISVLNFTCCMINSSVLFFAFMLTGMLQPFILLDPEYYDVGQDHIGAITSIALLVELITKILTLIPYGHYSDKLSRKLVIYYGSASFLAACLILSSESTVLSGFIVSKILLSNASSSLYAAPLLADYTADESKGHASGLQVLCMRPSVILSNLFIKFLLYQNISLGKCYTISGIVVTLIIVINSFGLKRGDYHAIKPTTTAPTSASTTASTNHATVSTENIDATTTNETNKQNVSSDKISVYKNLKEAFKAFKESGWLQISLILQVCGTATSFIFFTYMSVYVKSLFPADTDENTANITVNNIQTLMFVPSFFCSVIFGYLMNKQERALRMATTTMIIIVTAFIMMGISTSPDDISLIFSAVLIGASMPALFVISGFLSIKHYPPGQRGIMVGFLAMISNVLYFVLVSSAGVLYDHWIKQGPFILGIGLLIAGLLVLVGIYKAKGLNSVK